MSASSGNGSNHPHPCYRFKRKRCSI